MAESGVLVSHPIQRLRLPEAAKFLGVSARSLASKPWRERLQIPCFYIGRAVIFDPVALDRWIAEHQQEARDG